MSASKIMTIIWVIISVVSFIFTFYFTVDTNTPKLFVSLSIVTFGISLLTIKSLISTLNEKFELIMSIFWVIMSLLFLSSTITAMFIDVSKLSLLISTGIFGLSLSTFLTLVNKSLWR